MSISFEKIEELRKRANISYEEAKCLLEKHNEDVLEALIELEKSKRINEHCCDFHSKKCSSKIKRLFKKGMLTRFIITKNDNTIVNLPVNYGILSLIFSFHFVIISLILVFIFGCKMSIKKLCGEQMNVDDVMVDLSKRAKKAVNNIKDEFNSIDTDTKKEEAEFN